MSKTIWKFPLETVDRQTVPLPVGAKILTVQAQGEQPRLWAIVDSDAEKVAVEIRIHGTGHELPEDSNRYEHLGTYQLASGALVFHVFRVLTHMEIVARML